MTNKMIEKYYIVLTTQNNEPALRLGFAPSANDRQYIVDNKQTIIKILQEKEESAKKAKAEREAKINAIDGLELLKKAMGEWSNYHYYMTEKRFENEATSSFAIDEPTPNIKDLQQEYPRANAFLQAEKYCYSENIDKSAIGKKAIEKIINGEDYQNVIAEMEAEWSDFVSTRMFD